MFSHQRILGLVLCLCAVGFGQSGFWPSNPNPAISSTNNSSAITVGLRFYSDVPGKVTGVRFFKGRYNTGRHVGQLWNGDGALLGSVTFTNESRDGWQEATFARPISISARSTYVISYSAQNGRNAANVFYDWSEPSASPLHVEGASPGVFRLGSGSLFPTTSWFRANYWVDVVFIPDAVTPPAPVQISVSPASVSLNGGDTAPFTASVTGATNTSVTWTISPQAGSITTGGRYTAPAVVGIAQKVTVTARSVADSTKFASASVDLLPTAPTTYTVSGNISGTSATVSLSGLSGATTATDSSGNYSFTGLQNGLYVVVPSKTGYSFSPATKSVTVNSASVSGVNFTAVVLPPAPRTVSLNWSPSSSPDVVGYNLYRSTSNGGPYSKINSSPITGTSYVDSNVSTAPTYFYVATTVGDSGVESTFSNQAEAAMK